LSSRNQPAAPQWAASQGVGGREGEHDGRLEQEERRVKTGHCGQVSQLPKLALPLIALPGTSPRIVTGRRGWPQPGAYSATQVIGEADDDSAPLPVTIRGEDAGRQVRGSANA